MKIAIVGGIFGSEEGLALGRITPEIVLAAGLQARGHEVGTYSHYDTVSAGKYDVVHVHHLSFGALAMAFNRSHTPFVFTSHDPRAMSSLLPPARRLAFSIVFGRADACVALSRTEATFQRVTYGLEACQVEVIPNGQPADIFSFGRTNGCGEDGCWNLLYVGQLTPLKRVDVLIRALSKLPPAAHLDLVYHVDHLLESLRDLSRALGVDDRVHFRGSYTPLQLREAYQRCDVFVLPSAGESLPTVVIEAMMCGAPVVATDVGGVREQVGDLGRVVPANSVEALSSAIRQVLDDYPAVHSQSSARSGYARRTFSVDAMVAAHEALYARLIGTRPARAKFRGNTTVNTLATRLIRAVTRRGLSKWLPLVR